MNGALLAAAHCILRFAADDEAAWQEAEEQMAAAVRDPEVRRLSREMAPLCVLDDRTRATCARDLTSRRLLDLLDPPHPAPVARLLRPFVAAAIAQRAVRLENSVVTRALAASHRAILIFDRGGHMLHATPAAQTLLGDNGATLLAPLVRRFRCRASPIEAMTIVASGRSIHAQPAVLDDETLQIVLTSEERAEPALDDDETCALTPRERVVARELIAGRMRSEIAARLGISGETVKWHARQIYRKLKVRRRDELVRRAIRDTAFPHLIPS